MVVVWFIFWTKNTTVTNALGRSTRTWNNLPATIIHCKFLPFGARSSISSTTNIFACGARWQPACSTCTWWCGRMCWGDRRTCCDRLKTRNKSIRYSQTEIFLTISHINRFYNFIFFQSTTFLELYEIIELKFHSLENFLRTPSPLQNRKKPVFFRFFSDFPLRGVASIYSSRDFFF